MENEQTTLADVLRLAEGGWRLFPCSARDKRPLTPHAFHDATTDAAQLVEWAERHPGCLWATPDALVLDVDTHDGGADGYAAYRALADENGGDGGAVAVPTRSGGLHLFYRNPDDSIGRRPGVRPGLDLLGRDGYKVLWHPDKLPALADLPDPPSWVVGLSKSTNGAGPTSSPIEYDDGEAIPYGQRHAVFVRFAGRLRRMGLGEDSIEAAMLDTLLPRCQPERPDTRAHMRRVASSVASRYDPADLFDALHLEDLNPGDLDAVPAAESSWLRFVDVSTFDGLPRPAPEVAVPRLV